jgi:hypothetical protein
LQVGLVIHDGVVQSKRQHQLHRRIATANTLLEGVAFMEFSKMRCRWHSHSWHSLAEK